MPNNKGGERSDFSAILNAIPFSPPGPIGKLTEEKGGALLPGAGLRVQELAARFVRRLQERQLEGVALHRAHLSTADGLHIEVQKGLSDDEKVDFYVRFHASGTDAVVEWHRREWYGRCGYRHGIKCGFFIVLGIGWFLVFLGPIGIVVLIMAWILTAWGWSRSTIGAYRYSRSITLAKDLQLSVRATLDEAIDEAQLTDYVRPIDDNGTKRVI